MKNGRFRENKTRNKSMAFVISLGLILATGSAVGTWASYTSKADACPVTAAAGTLKTHIGNVNGDCSSGVVNITGLVPGQTSAPQDFKIQNVGSLPQKVNASFEKAPGSTIPDADLDKFTYTLQFKREDGKTSEIYRGTLGDLMKSKDNTTFNIEIQNEDGSTSSMCLKPGEFIIGTMSITAGGNLSPGARNKQLVFSIKAAATQLSDPSWNEPGGERQ